MLKQEFLDALKSRLAGLPQKEVEERLDFYSEMIDDKLEENISEEDAVAEMGPIEDIASQIIGDIPFSKIIKEKARSKKGRMSTLEIVLLIIGSPIWLSLVISAIAVIFSVYVSIWAVIISLWSAFASFVACAFGGLLAGIIFAVSNNAFVGIATVAASFVLAGLSVFTFFGCKLATIGTIKLTKASALSVKKRFIAKEDA